MRSRYRRWHARQLGAVPIPRGGADWAPQTYLLRGRLRGQQGTDGRDAAGLACRVVCRAAGRHAGADGPGAGTAPQAAALPDRICARAAGGSVLCASADPAFSRASACAPMRRCICGWSGGLGAGHCGVTWVRRTRIEGDSWDLEEVPLGEETESYRIRVLRGSAVLREAVSASTALEWTYPAACAGGGRGAGGRCDLEVAQRSARFGAGPCSHGCAGMIRNRCCPEMCRRWRGPCCAVPQDRAAFAFAAGSFGGAAEAAAHCAAASAGCIRSWGDGSL